MTRVLLLYVAIIFSCLFMFFPDGVMVGFLFSDMKVTLEFWAYYLFEHLILVVLAMALLYGETQYRTALVWFFWVQVIDTLDYVLFYGDSWFPVSWNHIKVATYTGVVLKTWYDDIRYTSD